MRLTAEQRTDAIRAIERALEGSLRRRYPSTFRRLTFYPDEGLGGGVVVQVVVQVQRHGMDAEGLLLGRELAGAQGEAGLVDLVCDAVDGAMATALRAICMSPRRKREIWPVLAPCGRCEGVGWLWPDGTEQPVGCPDCGGTS